MRRRSAQKQIQEERYGHDPGAEQEDGMQGGQESGACSFEQVRQQNLSVHDS